jgi:serine/threonine protein kinase/ligand-binding sensor domain-containing protein
MNQYIGKTLGAYQVLEQIGQGGMATIFKAYHPAMDRYVAVKILASHFTQDETFVPRFTQEARTLARLEHPHVLPVYDYGEQQGVTYLVMRYIEAGTLKDLISQRGPLELEQAARILDQVGRALGYAHSQGVIHRDIKPANVLIDARGDAFLTDFGIAKIVAGTAQYTATGAIVGTPAYMSPEQGLGEPADQRSDIYALGVVLYEMVTGQVPFEAETPLAVLLQHVNSPMPPPRQVKPDLPEAVERVILKALAKSPDDRFQKAEDVIEAFRKALAGPTLDLDAPSLSAPFDQARPEQSRRAHDAPFDQPFEAQPVAAAPLPETLIESSARKSRAWLPIVAAGAVLALAALVVMLFLSNQGDDGPPAAPPPTNAPALDTAPSPPPSGTPGQDTTVAPKTELSPGWTNYSNANFVYALAFQDDYLWAGGPGGLVRWNIQDGSYDRFGVSDGLASNWVNDLLVDEDDNLWVASYAGISRFDGESWVTFDEVDGLDTSEVISLFMDEDGNLWAGTAYGERGLNYYDGASWGAPPFPPIPLDFPRPRAFALSEEWGLFVGLDENGLAYFDGGEWIVFTQDDGLPGNQIRDLLLVDDETLLISFGNEVVRIDLLEDELDTIPQLSDIGVQRMLQSDDESLWFVGEGGAVRYDPDIGDWQRFESGGHEIPVWMVSDIVQGYDELWFSAVGAGVVRYDGDDWQLWATDDELGGNDVEVIRQDGSGALWFVHGGSGLSRYDPASDEWQTFDGNDGITDWPSYPGVDGEGHLWIGEYETLWRYEERGWRSFEPVELQDISIRGLVFGPGGVQWLWTDAGLVSHDSATGEWTLFSDADYPGLADLEMVYITRDGTLWANGDNVLIRYDGSNWSAPPLQQVENISEITAAPDGSPWMVADGDLYHLDGERWVSFSWPGGGWIENVAVAPDGSVWAGHDGLGRLDPSTGQWQIFNPEHGLVHDDVQAIHVTLDGVVWIGTEGGVSRYVPED